MCSAQQWQRLDVMMKFPSQAGRSARNKALRLCIVMTGVLVFAVSILGFGYALKPTAGEMTTAGFDTIAGKSAGSTSAQVLALGEKYGNGRIPTSELVQVAPGRYLTPDAAAGFSALAAGLRAAGHEVKINSAYRTLAEQEELVSDLGLLGEGGTAAAVGTSEHGMAISVDLTLSGAALTWMLARAQDYGFSKTVAEEPWHWTWIGID